MIMLTWNVERSRATAGALEIADQVAADVIFLQEASIGQSWHGPICSEQVQGRAWGSAVLVRDGSLEPIAIHGYSGWVTGACWRPKPTDVSETIYLFSIHSPTANNDEPRGGYVAESLEIVLARRHQGLPLPQTLRWNRAPATPYHCDGFLLRGMDVTSVQCESSLRGTSPVRATIAPSCCGLEWLVLANIRMEPTRRTGPCNHGAAGARLI